MTQSSKRRHTPSTGHASKPAEKSKSRKAKSIAAAVGPGPRRSSSARSGRDYDDEYRGERYVEERDDVRRDDRDERRRLDDDDRQMRADDRRSREADNLELEAEDRRRVRRRDYERGRDDRNDPGSEVLSALGRWRDEMTDAVEAMGSDPARSGVQQVAAMLKAQRSVLEQVKASLTEFQKMIETVEARLEGGNGHTGNGLPMMAPMTGFMPKGAAEMMSLPMRAPMTAMLSMQKVALSSVGLWAKAAEDCHGMWAGAVQSMVPNMANGGRKERRQSHED